MAAEDITIPPHLRIYNFERSTTDETAQFHLFSSLPKELRLKIIRHALQRNRLIQVVLCSATEAVGPNGRDTLPVGHRGPYSVVVGGNQILSKFLRVNRESRDETLRFYHINIPCRFTKGVPEDGLAFPGILHFNSEYDFLQMRNGTLIRDSAAHFLSSIKTKYDPRGIGVLNLAIDSCFKGEGDLKCVELTDLTPKVELAFLETLRQLREVIFVCRLSIGRQNTGGIRTRRSPFFCRSFPIFPPTPTFERLSYDPRPIRRDLGRVLTGIHDSRKLFVFWFRLLEQWNIDPVNILYRYALTYDLSFSFLTPLTLKETEEWLQEEERSWLNPNETIGCAETRWEERERLRLPEDDLPGEINVEEPEKSVRPALGFWLFPLDAIGPWEEEFQAADKRVLDLTQHWPELALATSI